MKIAVFDSGVGGITVLKELHARFPFHDFYYYGDTAHVPYGTKSHTQIKHLVQDAAREIKKQNVDALVLACNTASCVALDECREIMGDVPVYNVVEAGVSTITNILEKAKKPTPVLILGTRVTIRSKTYSTLLKENAHQEIIVYEQECPLLVPMIEEGWMKHRILKDVVDVYVKPYKKLKPGIAFLACTHYPWIKSAIKKALPKWKVIDSAVTMSEILEKQFDTKTKRAGKIEWNFTDPETIHSFAVARDTISKIIK